MNTFVNVIDQWKYFKTRYGRAQHDLPEMLDSRESLDSYFRKLATLGETSLLENLKKWKMPFELLKQERNRLKIRSQHCQQVKRNDESVNENRNAFIVRS